MTCGAEEFPVRCMSVADAQARELEERISESVKKLLEAVSP